VKKGVHPAACIIVDTLVTLALSALSGVIAFTISKLSDSGWYFAFFQDEQGVEYLRIVLAFGILGAYVMTVELGQINWTDFFDLRLFHLIALVLAICELKQRRRASNQKYVPGHYDGSFSNRQQHQNFGEAPPAYTGPPQPMQQSTAYQPQDEISSSQPLYELPAKKVEARPELGQGNFYVADLTRSK
jgi:hypothetical protein